MSGASFEAAYGGRRVLVTGHTGFTGGWLCSWLEALGAEVHGLSLAPETEPNLFERLGLKAMQGEEPMRAVGGCSGGCATKEEARAELT